ncbi:MAG: hypothetical protein LBH60_03095 [Prevotellaceae bacterium]|jgi:hypothetical protein|nr:hypothetical protein [Prevotellaceae bacterium]
MINVFETRDFSDIVTVGDKAPVKPDTEKGRTKSGLYLYMPAGLHEKEKISSGHVFEIGDLAIFLRDSVRAVLMSGERYFTVHSSSVLMPIRDDSLF